MVRVAVLLVTAWFGIWTVMPVTAAEESLAWKAAAAKAVITPREPLWMAGYASRTGPSDGVLVDLYAKAAALVDAGGHRLVIVTLDLIEIPEKLRASLLQQAQQKYGLEPRELLLNVSHTHGGPMVSAQTVADWGVSEPWGARAEKYVDDVEKTILQLVGQVLTQLQPVSLSYCHARCGFAMNRRLPSAAGFQLAPYPDGPVDHDVPVLKIESAEKKLLAVVFTYACHNTAIGGIMKINGDYAGYAQQNLERTHEGTIALFLAGCGGDQDPQPRRSIADAEQLGNSLASAVEAALVPEAVALPAKLESSLEMCPLAFAPLPPRSELEAQANSPDGFVSRHARRVLKQWPNAGDQPPDYDLPIQIVRLGDRLTMVVLGGEPVVDYSLRLKRELSSEKQWVWVTGYSNLVNCYVPNRRVLLEGGYEATGAVIYQSRPGPFHIDVEERIVQSVHRQVDQLRAAGQR